MSFHVTPHDEYPFQHNRHHGEGIFLNPKGSAHHRDGRHSAAMLGLLAELALSGNQRFEYPPEHVWPRHRALTGLQRLNEAPGLTWLGQACYYLGSPRHGILTDPFLSHRASPLPFSGPKRLVPAPVHPTDLPRLDAIVVSHNHYDHLDTVTLKRLANKSIPVITTLGTGAAIRKQGLNNVIELDWYQQVEIDGNRYTALPCYHFSGRSLRDSNRALWASFAIETPDAKVFFAGDTGYGDVFRTIGRTMGPFDVALVPIGAYGPRFIMAKVHADPEEAVAIGEDVGARFLAAMHWGTVRLTNEPMMEPKSRFEAALRSPAQGKVFGIGETCTYQEVGLME